MTHTNLPPVGTHPRYWTQDDCEIYEETSERLSKDGWRDQIYTGLVVAGYLVFVTGLIVVWRNPSAIFG